MCHHNWHRREKGFEEVRDERLWDLFHRETQQSPPPEPVARREEDLRAEVERDEVTAER